MELQRIFLLSGVLVTGFLLWTNWQESHRPVQSPVVQSRAVDNAVPTNGITAQTHTDVPAPAFVSTGETHEGDPSHSQHTIAVITDKFELLIDRKGGNLIQAKLKDYKTTLAADSPEVEILSASPETLYIAQSGLVSALGPDSQEHGQALLDSAHDRYVMGDADELIVPLTFEKDGLLVTKQFTFKKGHYDVAVDYRIQNEATVPFVGQFYAQFKRAKQTLPKVGFGGFSTFSGAAVSTPEKRYQKLSYDTMAKENLQLTAEDGWIAMQQHYFLSAWIPHTEQQYTFKTFKPVDNVYRLAMLGPTLTVLPGQTLETGARFFVGPEDTSVLKTLAPGLELTIDYGWFWPISQGLFWLMDKFFELTKNWGVAIILTTVLIKLLFYKLSETSYRSMANMRRLQPKMDKLKEKFGDDKQKMSQAVMELYKTEKINPLGGCLPILVQIPVFIALYWVLIESVELRHAPFFWWIQDLSAKDPFYVLPLLMGVTMLVQQKLSPPPPDPTQAKVMLFMPVFFTLLFLSFPAGLVLYWTVNNILSIAQQAWVMKKMGAL